MGDCKFSSNLSDIVKVINETSGEIVLFTHTKPDGDAFGSLTALLTALRFSGKNAKGCLVPPIPDGIERMEQSNFVQIGADLSKYQNAELYIVVDTSAYSQLGPAASIIKNNPDKTIVIDHHINGDIAAGHRYIESEAAACCQIIAELIEQMLAGRGGLKSVDGAGGKLIKNSLFLGIATDTGWFRFSNTTAKTHYLAGRLIEQGVDHALIYQRIEQMERVEKISLLARGLKSIKYIADNRAAIMQLSQKDFEQTGALSKETERLIDIPQQVASIKVVALLSERPNEDTGKANEFYTRISFRSKPGEGAVDVAKLASEFGGGGHVRAAGARVDAPVDIAVKQVEDSLEKLFIRKELGTRES